MTGTRFTGPVAIIMGKTHGHGRVEVTALAADGA